MNACFQAVSKRGGDILDASRKDPTVSKKLYFRFGAMNSGKSTALLQVAFNYEERGQRALIIKPGTDTKHHGVLSRVGMNREVDICAEPDANLFAAIKHAHMSSKVHCVLVDEAQFLSPAQVDQLFAVVISLDIPVVAYGLRTDFQTHMFPGSLRLLELAHSIEEMKTICRCGSKAMFNGRKIDGVFVKEGSQVAIDGQQATYESLCGSCYTTHVGTPTAATA